MSEFLVTYHGGERPKSSEEGAAHMKKWKAWVSRTGDKMSNPGTPLGKTSVLTAEGVSESGSSNPMSGFSIVKADSLDHAIELMNGCPMLEIGGRLEISEMMKMPG